MSSSSSLHCGILPQVPDVCQCATELLDLVHSRKRELVFDVVPGISLFHQPPDFHQVCFHVEGPRVHSFLFIVSLLFLSRFPKYLFSVWRSRVRESEQGDLCCLPSSIVVQGVAGGGRSLAPAPVSQLSTTFSQAPCPFR